MTVPLVVLDLDGTLLAPSGAVSPRVRAAVRAVHERGTLVTLATGRRLWAVRPIAEELGIRTPVILYNGAVVYDLQTETELIRRRLAATPYAAALDVVTAAGFQPVAYESPADGERVYTGPAENDDEATAHYFVRPAVAAQRVSLGMDRLRSVCEPLLLAAMGGELEVTTLAGLVNRSVSGCQTLIERQSFVPDSRWWQVDVTAPETSKGAALRELCALFEISLNETVAIGDGINDLELVTAAGLGVAMGNAVHAVRLAADATVADNAHDGAAEALERFVLCRSRLDAV
jgi:Cof subfamily protein (haloacid dehalogenase superfamily)